MDAEGIDASDSPQNEEGIVSTVELCRVCLLSNLMMRELFLESEVASLSAKAMSFANVKMLPGDGLPSRICCICADKLESAYEFKLQVEQADTVLREKFVSMNIKEELFFNEVEVHLEAEKQTGDMAIHVEDHYQNTRESLTSMSQEEKSSLLKDQLDLLNMEKLVEHGRTIAEESNTMSMEHVIDQTISMQQTSDDCINHEEESMMNMTEDQKDKDIMREESRDTNDLVSIPTVEHDYMLREECMLSNKDQPERQELHEQQLASVESYNPEDGVEYEDLVVKVVDATNEEDEDDEEVEEVEGKVEKPNDIDAVVKVELQSSWQNGETRRSKRKITRRNLNADRDSDEENYFENLNLSSRLKTTKPTEKSGNAYFLCYLCDKEFISKNVLKEHMHSHEEVRKTLSLKKISEIPQKNNCNVVKTPPSGKRSNKCPYCGKQYVYIISFSKHLKKHEREKVGDTEDPMPLEISFHEDEHSLDLCEKYDGERRHLSTEYQKRVKQKKISVKSRKEMTSSADEVGMGDEHERQMEETEEWRNDEQKVNAKEQDESVMEEESVENDIHTKVFACDKCTDKFYTKRGLRKHTVSHFPLKCNACEEEFDSLEKLRDHRAKHVVKGLLAGQDFDINVEFQKNTEMDDYDMKTKERQEEDCGGENEEAVVSSGLSETDNPGGMNRIDRDVEMQQCSETNYNCKVCCQPFATMDLLQRHTEQQHERNKTYKCTECSKVYGSELTLRNHLIATNHKTFVHGQEYDTNKRIKRVAARAAQKIIDKIKTEDYDEDEENHSRVDRSSSVDGIYGRNKRNVPSQKKGNCKKEQEYANRNKKCNFKQSSTKHMEENEKSEQQRMSKSDKQKQAGNQKERQRNEEVDNADNKDDDYDSDFESGLDWPMDNHECPKCKKRYSTKKSLLRHQLSHEEPNFECDICNVKFYRKDKLKAHYDKCSERNPDQVRKCNICGDTFENNEILREHRSKHVTEGILTEEDLRDIEPRPEEEKTGEKVGRKRRTDIVGLECTECNKQYTSRKGLLRHIQVHEGKKYLCDICPKKFYRREHLKIHVAKHNMIKPYKCTRCTKRFIKEEQLTNHLSKHDRTFKKNKETDSSKRFLCEICSKSFTQSTTLIAHLRAHYGIKPYVCEVCSRPFTTNSYLKMHMRTHTQERPYICQYCTRAFARADTLANHLTSHTGEAKYHCKDCPKNFRRLKSLKEHVFIHTGQRPYACPTCDRRFNNNGSRYAHSKRCKQNFVQNQNRAQTVTAQVVQPVQNQQRVLQHATIGQGQIVKAQNIKTITITRQPDSVGAQQTVLQHQEILMPLILPLTVTLADVGEEVILPEGTKIFTTS